MGVKKLKDYNDDDFITKYMPAIRAMAFRLKERLPSSIDVNDLIAIGVEEMVKLSRRYDINQNDSFWGYAKKRVYGSMLDYLRSLDVVSRNNRRLIKAIEIETSKYLTEHSREPSENFLAEKLGEPLKKIRDAKQAAEIAYNIPLNEQIIKNSQDMTTNEKIMREHNSKLILKYLPSMRTMAYKLKERLTFSVDINNLISIGIEELIQQSKKYDIQSDKLFWLKLKKGTYHAVFHYLINLDVVNKNDKQFIVETRLIIKKIIDENLIKIEENQKCIKNKIEQNKLIKSIKHLLLTLSDRDQAILQLYYDYGMNLKEISHLLEISESRISQIHKKTIEKIKEQIIDPD